MITNNYCAFHASKGPRWGPRASIQKKGGGLAGRWGGGRGGMMGKNAKIQKDG